MSICSSLWFSKTIKNIRKLSFCFQVLCKNTVNSLLSILIKGSPGVGNQKLRMTLYLGHIFWVTKLYYVGCLPLLKSYSLGQIPSHSFHPHWFLSSKVYTNMLILTVLISSVLLLNYLLYRIKSSSCASPITPSELQTPWTLSSYPYFICIPQPHDRTQSGQTIHIEII